MGDDPTVRPDAATAPDPAGIGPVGRRGHRNRWADGAWRSLFFAPIGDGQTRRRGSDAVRVGIALLVILVCGLATRVNPSSERAFIHALTPPPDGIRWLVTTVWWTASVGLTVAVVVLALVSRRWSVLRDCLLTQTGALTGGSETVS